MKRRLDVLLVERGLAESRTRAQAVVLEGKVRVNGQVETKASRQVDMDAEVEVEKPPRFVSRGGEKLEGAFTLWGEESLTSEVQRLTFAPKDGAQTSNVKPQTSNIKLSVQGRVCLDVGSSTGGFTDCLLQHGAKMVMAVDVGTNQLAYKLRVDPRVWVRENFNARSLTAADLPERPSRAVTDVSFISLKLILPPMAEVLLPGGEIVSLVKPQFEAGRGQAPGGVVSDPAVRRRVVEDISAFGTQTLGLALLGVAESPIRGREKGNVEYLAWWRKPGGGQVAEALRKCYTSRV